MTSSTDRLKFIVMALAALLVEITSSFKKKDSGAQPIIVDKVTLLSLGVPACLPRSCSWSGRIGSEDFRKGSINGSYGAEVRS